MCRKLTITLEVYRVSIRASTPVLTTKHTHGSPTQTAQRGLALIAVVFTHRYGAPNPFCLDSRRPSCPEVAWQDKVVPQVDQQGTVDEFAYVSRSPSRRTPIGVEFEGAGMGHPGYGRRAFAAQHEASDRAAWSDHQVVTLPTLIVSSSVVRARYGVKMVRAMTPANRPLVGGVAVSLVLALAVVTIVWRDGDGKSLLEPSAAAAGTTQTSSETPASTSKQRKPKDIGKVWPRWDPRRVDELPPASAKTAPALPEFIKPPASSPLMVDDPAGVAVAAVERRGVAHLLSPNGVWRTVPLDGRNPRLALSPDGTRLAVSYDGERTLDVTVYDLCNGEARVLPEPSSAKVWDLSSWMFLTEDKLLLDGGQASYVVTVDSGSVNKVPIAAGLSRTVDPAGNVLVSANWGSGNALTDYRGGTPREVSMRLTGRLSTIRADANTVAGTSYQKRPYALYVADRATLTPEASLPLRDRSGYSNGGLRTLALAQKGEVLFHFAAAGPNKTGQRVVAWDPRDGELSLVSSLSVPVFSTSVVFAEGLLSSGRMS